MYGHIVNRRWWPSVRVGSTPLFYCILICLCSSSIYVKSTEASDYYNSWNNIADWLNCINKLLFYLTDFNALDINDNAGIYSRLQFKRENNMWINYFVSSYSTLTHPKQRASVCICLCCACKKNKNILCLFFLSVFIYWSFLLLVPWGKIS